MASTNFAHVVMVWGSARRVLRTAESSSESAIQAKLTVAIAQVAC
jgi:hypothetical protein